MSDLKSILTYLEEQEREFNQGESMDDLQKVKLFVESLIATKANSFNPETVGEEIALSLLEETTDYEECDLTEVESEIIFKKCKQHEDKDHIERLINVTLQSIGFRYDQRKFKWVR